MKTFIVIRYNCYDGWCKAVGGAAYHLSYLVVTINHLTNKDREIHFNAFIQMLVYCNGPRRIMINMYKHKWGWFILNMELALILKWVHI